MCLLVGLFVVSLCCLFVVSLCHLVFAGWFVCCLTVLFVCCLTVPSCVCWQAEGKPAGELCPEASKAKVRISAVSSLDNTLTLGQHADPLTLHGVFFFFGGG